MGRVRLLWNNKWSGDVAIYGIMDRERERENLEIETEREKVYVFYLSHYFSQKRQKKLKCR